MGRNVTHTWCWVSKLLSLFKRREEDFHYSRMVGCEFFLTVEILGIFLSQHIRIMWGSGSEVITSINCYTDCEWPFSFHCSETLWGWSDHMFIHPVKVSHFSSYKECVSCLNLWSNMNNHACSFETSAQKRV